MLRGLDDHHWPRIRQVAIELHDVDGRLEATRSLLTQHGLRVFTEQDALMAKIRTWNVYAVR